MGWKAVTTQLVLALGPPAYLLYRFVSDPASFQNASITRFTLGGLVYLWLLTQRIIPFFFSPFNSLPTPPGEGFFWGNVPQLFERPAGAAMAAAVKKTPNDGIVLFRGLMHWRRTLVLTQPDTIMEVLNTHCYDWEKPGPARRFLARILGEGLVNVEGHEHKMQRKAVAPAFSGRNIRDLVPLFWSKGLDFVAGISRDLATSADQTVELKHTVSRVTLDIIGAAGLGVDFRTLENGDDELATQYAIITDPEKGNIVAYFIVNMIFPPWIVRYLPMRAHRIVANASLTLRKIVRQLLADKHAAMLEKTSAQRDIIATIIRSGSFSDDYLTDQLLTFLAAGHETTASALTWTAWLLAERPEMQTRLREEIIAHLGHKSPQEVDADIFDAMPYLNAVSHESLRFYPTVPATARHCVRDTQIGNLHVPKGTFAIIAPWCINRLTSLWGPDAEEFNPDRWIKGDRAATGGAASPIPFITFLHGPRSCIGRGFAIAELKALLAAFVLNFEWEMADPNEKVEPAGVVTIKPKNGLRIRLKPVQRKA